MLLRSDDGRRVDGLAQKTNAIVETSRILAERRPRWRELEELCSALAHPWKRRTLKPEALVRFSDLYRSACADLALADAYQLPPETVRYLHQLVGRAHNQLYRAKSFDVRGWGRELLVDLPRRLAADRILWLAAALFYGMFFASAVGAVVTPDYAMRLVGEETLAGVESSFSSPLGGRDAQFDAAMAGFYILNNATIGLRCFVFGLFWGVGGLYETLYNALLLGAIFGHMASSPAAKNFFEFVAAHGPFELTAIVLCAAAGMRLGFSLVFTDGYTRTDALRRAGRQAMPTVGLAVLLFFGAALIEAFVSPSELPLVVKIAVAVGTAGMLAAYFCLPLMAKFGHAADSVDR